MNKFGDKSSSSQRIILPGNKLYLPNKYLNHSTFSHNAQSHFDVFFDQLKKTIGCTYMSYALEIDNTRRIHYYSNDQWQNTFVAEKLINVCPLIAYAQHFTQGILVWNHLLTSLDKKQLITVEARADHGIGNGIGLKQMVYGMSEIISFASTPNDIFFGDRVSHKIQLIKPFVLGFRTIAIASMIAQGYLEPDKIQFYPGYFWLPQTVTIH